jgi:hypothetical protein
VYEQVLRDGTTEDLRILVDRDQMRDLWDQLVLSLGQAWATWFPQHRNIEIAS